MISDRLNHFLKAATALLGLGLVLLTCVYFLREATMVHTWSISGGVTQTRFEYVGEDSTVVIRRVEEKDFASGLIPQKGDTVVSIFKLPANSTVVDSLMQLPHPVGEIYPLTYLKDGVPQETALVMSEPEGAGYWMIVLLQWLRFLIAMGFMGVAMWAFFAQPDAAQVRAFALFCYSMTAFMISGVSVLGDAHAAFNIPFWNIITRGLNANVILFSAYWLNLHMLFPRPMKLMERHPVIAYLLCYAVPVLTVAINLFLEDADTPGWLELIINSSIAVQFLVGLIVPAFRIRYLQSKVERRQVRLVLWGTAMGILPIIAMIASAIFFRDWLVATPLRFVSVINISLAMLLIAPISYAYAFGKYRLLEVQGKIRRGTRYALLIAAVGVVYSVIAVLVSNFVVQQLQIKSDIPVLVIAIGIAMGTIPILRRARAFLEKKFFPERLRLRAHFERFLESPEHLVSRETFWSALGSLIQQELMVKEVRPVLAGINGAQYTLGEFDKTPFADGSAFVSRLARERRPILMDELLAAERVQLSDEEYNWISENHVALVMPLVVHSRLVGFLGIGTKTIDEDYSPEELSILSSYAPQVAMAGENARLVEENVEKRRLEEQMEIARRIQVGFLPNQLPETRGLTVAAGSKFSLEVAGDYYDVIDMPDGRTVLAIADVSGKGAGAALLMANLQASLRTAIVMGVKLEEAVGRVNDLIHRNTPPEQYITFAVGMYDPETKTLVHVNAGHNPPLIARAGGKVEQLEKGGLILGCLPGSVYESETVELREGDLLVMFTDGVSEAMNDAEEEYGEQRIAEFVKSHRSLSPDEVLRELEADVLRFCGREPNEDDRTLLIARCCEQLQKGCGGA